MLTLYEGQWKTVKKGKTCYTVINVLRTINYHLCYSYNDEPCIISYDKKRRKLKITTSKSSKGEIIIYGC